MIKYGIILLLIIIIFLLNPSEHFTYFNFNYNINTPKSFINSDNFFRISLQSNKNTTSIYQNRFSFIPVTINDDKLSNDNNNIVTNYDEIKSNKCCLVKKKFDDGQFSYEYKKYLNNECDLNNFELDQNNQLFFDGINGWTNDMCSNEKSNLGSCKHYDFECIDFISEKQCNTYNANMPPDPQNRKISFKWNKKTCNG